MKILIVDDHPICRKGLIALLDQMEPDTALLQANDGAQALALIAENDDLDVVILDLVIPGMDGLRAIAEFGKMRPEQRIMLSLGRRSRSRLPRDRGVARSDDDAGEQPLGEARRGVFRDHAGGQEQIGQRQHVITKHNPGQRDGSRAADETRGQRSRPAEAPEQQRAHDFRAEQQEIGHRHESDAVLGLRQQMRLHALHRSHAGKEHR
jgi:CheY-like chemotaxis protein